MLSMSNYQNSFLVETSAQFISSYSFYSLLLNELKNFKKYIILLSGSGRLRYFLTIFHSLLLPAPHFMRSWLRTDHPQGVVRVGEARGICGEPRWNAGEVGL